MKEYLFDTLDTLNTALTNSIKADISGQLVASGACSIAVGGGRTPIALLNQLSDVEIDWSNITITLTDERWVETDQPESNERMVKQHLLKNKAASASFVPLKTAYRTAKSSEFSLDATLHEQLPSVDFVVLGMGADGHFASLFPDTEELADGLDPENPMRCIATHGPVEPIERMSLTLSMLLTAKKIYLLICGDDKLAVYRRACLTDQPESCSLPISAVLKQSIVPVELYWSPASS